MDLKITSDKENKTIGRREIAFTIFSDAGVKRDDLKTELCKSLNISPNSTIVVRIDSGFGSKMSTGLAHSYKSEDALKMYENRGLMERLGIVEKKGGKKAAPAAAPEAKKEAKQEAKQEAKPAEEKK